jgi:hypothetical protein
MLESVVEQRLDQGALGWGQNVCCRCVLQSNLPVSTPPAGNFLREVSGTQLRNAISARSNFRLVFS